MLNVMVLGTWVIDHTRKNSGSLDIFSPIEARCTFNAELTSCRTILTYSTREVERESVNVIHGLNRFNQYYQKILKYLQQIK